MSVLSLSLLTSHASRSGCGGIRLAATVSSTGSTCSRSAARKRHLRRSRICPTAILQLTALKSDAAAASLYGCSVFSTDATRFRPYSASIGESLTPRPGRGRPLGGPPAKALLAHLLRRDNRIVRPRHARGSVAPRRTLSPPNPPHSKAPAQSRHSASRYRPFPMSRRS